MKLWQSFLCKVSAISVGEDTRIALPWEVGNHPLLLVLLSSFFGEEIKQLWEKGRRGGGTQDVILRR